MTGLGADMFMLVYIAKTGEVKFINGTGVAPMAATVDFYKAKGGMPDEGVLSVSVPGAVGGAELAAKTYGTRPLAELFAPAVELAERGFPVTESLARAPIEQLAATSCRRRRRRSGSRATSRSRWAIASSRRISRRTLREIGAQGSAAFYQRPDRREVRRLHEGERRPDRQKDLAGIRANEDTPIHINYKGVEVYECPPNSQGFVMLQALNILEGMNVRYMRPQQRAVPARGHRVAEAGVRRSQQVRRRSEVRAATFRCARCCRRNTRRRGGALIDPDRAIDGEAPAGNPRQPTIQRVARRSPTPPRRRAGPLAPVVRRRGRPHDVPRGGRQGPQHGVGHLVAPEPVRQRARRRGRRLRAQQPDGLLRPRRERFNVAATGQARPADHQSGRWR